MSRNESDNLIANIIYKMISEYPLSRDEERHLKKWRNQSVYNRILMDEIYTDEKLKANLRQSFITDKNEFWKIVITYRAALHDGMPLRVGNFWQRLIKVKSKK